MDLRWYIWYLGVARGEGQLYILQCGPVVAEAVEGGRPVSEGQAQLRLAGRRREDGSGVESQGSLAVTGPVLLVDQKPTD